MWCWRQRPRIYIYYLGRWNCIYAQQGDMCFWRFGIVVRCVYMRHFHVCDFVIFLLFLCGFCIWQLKGWTTCVCTRIYTVPVIMRGGMMVGAGIYIVTITCWADSKIGFDSHIYALYACRTFEKKIIWSELPIYRYDANIHTHTITTTRQYSAIYIYMKTRLKQIRIKWRKNF